ncbi:MAG: glycosyltransferase [Chitinophagaceae bacterium]
MQEFPKLRCIPLAGYGLKFSSKKWKTFLKIIWQIPKILVKIKRENEWLTDFLANNKIDAIISDNRYGLYNTNIFSIFITHQLTIKTPFGKFFESRVRKLNYWFIQKFSECWVPDFEGNINMGGELSHPINMPLLPVKFLGRVSRIDEKQPSIKGIELLIILSGPEPQRTIFENILLNQLKGYFKPVVLVRGLPGEKETHISPVKNLCIYNHLDTDILANLICSATYIISRSGYSTIMDLTGLQKKCILVPTPGQTEQEYLAHYLSSRNICLSFHQSSFSLSEAILIASDTKFVHFTNAGEGQYKKVVSDFIDALQRRKAN